MSDVERLWVQINSETLLGGSRWDLVSRLITSITHIGTLVIPMLTHLLSLFDHPNRV